ncbi:MAG: hypothetical protein ACI8RZ_001633 [Myxococcota bacterium]|jgi:hypothetical protein
MALELVVELAAAGLAAWAAWLSVPRPPALDWQRLFKTSLSIGLYGEVIAAKQDKTDWEASVAALVPYHPAARHEPDLLASPDPAAIPTPALPGERALVESLVPLSTPVERYTRMFSDNEQTRDALLSDPTSLGAAFDPVAAIGVGATWEAISQWGDPVRNGLTRKLAHVVVVGVETDLAAVMAEQSGGRGIRLEEEGFIEALDAAMTSPADRIVFVAEGGGVSIILNAMHAHPGLRDRVLAVVSLGGDIAQSDTQKEWMAEHFTQPAMDTELNRSTPYLSAVLVDAADPLATDWAGQRWPIPPPDRSGRTPIQPVDLGPLPAAWLTERPDGLARALWVVLAFWL